MTDSTTRCTFETRTKRTLGTIPVWSVFRCEAAAGHKGPHRVGSWPLSAVVNQQNNNGNGGISLMVHIRKWGRSNGKLTECGAPATRDDVRASAWLKPFPKCPECIEMIRLRMLRMLDDKTRGNLADTMTLTGVGE